MCLSPWVKKLQRTFAQSVLSTQYRPGFDIGPLTKANPKSHNAALLRRFSLSLLVLGIINPRNVV